MRVVETLTKDKTVLNVTLDGHRAQLKPSSLTPMLTTWHCSLHRIQLRQRERKGCPCEKNRTLFSHLQPGTGKRQGTSQ